MHTLIELIKNMAASTPEGIVGVSGIMLFFAAIVVTALYRINEIKKNDHH